MVQRRNIMTSSRLFEIIYILLEKKKVTAPELAERFEVSVRTIYRDIDALSSAGIPVYCTQGKGGGIGLKTLSWTSLPLRKRNKVRSFSHSNAWQSRTTWMPKNSYPDCPACSRRTMRTGSMWTFHGGTQEEKRNCLKH